MDSSNAGPRRNDKLEARADVLIFTSAPLAEPLEVIGPVSIRLQVRGSSPHFDVFARLCDVDAKEHSWNVCDGRGIEIESLREDLDTTAPGGQLIFHAFGALAEFLRQVIAERTRHGLAAARARGIVGGRPTVMTPEKIAAARAMLPESTIAATAHQLGISRSTLYAHMEVLRGKDPDGQRDENPNR